MVDVLKFHALVDAATAAWAWAIPVVVPSRAAVAASTPASKGGPARMAGLVRRSHFYPSTGEDETEFGKSFRIGKKSAEMSLER